MKKKFFLYLGLLLVVQLQTMYPISAIAQTVADTTLQVESSDKTSISNSSVEKSKTTTTSISEMNEVADSEICRAIFVNFGLFFGAKHFCLSLFLFIV